MDLKKFAQMKVAGPIPSSRSTAAFGNFLSDALRKRSQKWALSPQGPGWAAKSAIQLQHLGASRPEATARALRNLDNTTWHGSIEDTPFFKSVNRQRKRLKASDLNRHIKEH